MCPVGAEQPAVLCRPVPSHGFLGVTPERAVGVEVLLGLLSKSNQKEENQERQSEQNMQSKKANFSRRSNSRAFLQPAAPCLFLIVCSDLSL